MSTFVSERLLSAALGGLLAAATMPVACSSHSVGGQLASPGEQADAAGPLGAEASTPAGDAASANDVGAPADADLDAGHDLDADAGPVADASLACPMGTDADAAAITSSTQDPNMTLPTFTSECNARGGVVEVEPHCGGSNSCRGMSWDTGTNMITEHTCKAMNACAGYSCIVCD